MNNDNDSNTPVTQDTAGASVQLGDTPNLTAAANDAAPAGEFNEQSAAGVEPETPVGIDLHSRLDALEKHFAALIVAVKRDTLALKDGSEGEFIKIGEEIKAVGASFASHANNLIQAGIHKAEDFFHLLYPHANPATIGEVPTPVEESAAVEDSAAAGDGASPYEQAEVPVDPAA